MSASAARDGRCRGPKVVERSRRATAGRLRPICSPGRILHRHEMAARLRETLPDLTAAPSNLQKPASIAPRHRAVLAPGRSMAGIILLAVLGTIAYRLTTTA